MRTAVPPILRPTGFELATTNALVPALDPTDLPP